MSAEEGGAGEDFADFFLFLGMYAWKAMGRKDDSRCETRVPACLDKMRRRYYNNHTLANTAMPEFTSQIWNGAARVFSSALPAAAAANTCNDFVWARLGVPPSARLLQECFDFEPFWCDIFR